MQNSFNSRFKDAAWLPVAQSLDVTIGGAGGIGSIVAFLMSRIGPQSISLYDNDTVNRHNLSNQLFSKTDMNKPKVEAIVNLCNNYSRYHIRGIEDLFTSSSPSTPVMFSCFDNMEAREQMFEVFKQNYAKHQEEGKPPIFIDGRLTAEQFYVYAVTPDRIEDYQKTLFPSTEAADLPCGFKGTTHNSFMIGSKMVALFTNHCFNLSVGENIRDVPFSLENEIFNMLETVTL
jgi:molybdopterin/thiamine biosynthesis adenylyltransferase